VIEEKSYLRELGGAPKAREKTVDLIKAQKSSESVTDVFM